MSAIDSHEKKTTHPRGDHQEAASRRRGLGWRQNRGGRLPDHFGEHGDLPERWKSQYSGVKKDTLKRLKELEKENARLKRLVADQALDMAILKEIAEGKW